MTFQSIRVRLIVVAAVMILLALSAAGASMAFIFQRHVENRVEQELEKHFSQLMAVVSLQENGTIKLLQSLADPRFDLPLSGLYWQIDMDGKIIARSRSLWDEKLHVPTPPTNEIDSHIHALSGPDGQNLFSLEKAVFLEHQGEEKLFVVTVGVERGEISDTVLSLSKDVAPALGVLGFVLLMATWAQLSLGLKPLAVIEKAVQGIREGGRSRIEDAVAIEIRPLVNELNALLAANEERTKQARQRAADLAHGLRTPLAILGSLSRTVEEGGMPQEGSNIRAQTEHMRQQVERELTKALSSTEEAVDWVDIKPLVDRLVRVVSMSPSAQQLRWQVDIADHFQCLMTRTDLNEIIGNIMENAQKWAKSKVHISLHNSVLQFDDDGEGVTPKNLGKLTERGFTTGDGKSSSGLGLAIVQQLANKNQIQLELAKSHLGGLSVQLRIAAHKLKQDDKPDAMRN